MIERDAVLDWLLDSDPAIRWQVLRDLEDAPPDTVRDERARVATTGWGAKLLALQAADGNWGGGPYSPKWTSTTYTLLLLRHLGVDPEAPMVRNAVGRVQDRVRMGAGDQRFFEYRDETCIAGMVLALGAYFGAEGHVSVADWLAREQLDDGGWNCRTKGGSRRSSFHTTISVLEGMLEHERRTGISSSPVTVRGREYLLERNLLRRATTGEIVSKQWLLFSFPPRWHYDVLRGLDHVRESGSAPDHRCAEAIDIVRRKRARDGRWPLQSPHRGLVHFELEGPAGSPSRWNTLRALRVLRWWGEGAAAVRPPRAHDT